MTAFNNNAVARAVELYRDFFFFRQVGVDVVAIDLVADHFQVFDTPYRDAHGSAVFEGIVFQGDVILCGVGAIVTLLLDHDDGLVLIRRAVSTVHEGVVPGSCAMHIGAFTPETWLATHAQCVSKSVFDMVVFDQRMRSLEPDTSSDGTFEMIVA